MPSRKLFHIRKPTLRISPNGKISVTRPSMRVGGKTGINISSKGVSASTRTRFGTINSKKGCSFHLSIALAFGVAAVFLLTKLLMPS